MRARGPEDSVPMTVVSVVNAICADYDRRKRLIAENKLKNLYEEPHKMTILEVNSRLNGAVDYALRRVEEVLREVMLYDIASGRGYYRSKAQTMISKGAYYRRRRRIVYDIAVELALV